MPLIAGSVFLAGALLSCLLPISLLIAFATFFYRQTRRLPANAEPQRRVESTHVAPTPAQAAQSNPYSNPEL